MKILIYLLCAIMVVLSGCTEKTEDSRLLAVAEKVSDSPEEMLARLDSMDVGSMKESDRYFHALMRIKAQDKAFVQHTSDSVILRVIDYYTRHKGSGHYPKALYYGGRVYSDIGDAPTALRYFQAALEALPEGVDDGLRNRIYSQMGGLLNSLRLYKEACATIKQGVRLKMADGDSINLMRDIQLLGSVYMHSKDYDLADSCFRNAREIAVGISHSDTVIHDMYMACTELYRRNISEALKRIRGVLEDLSGKQRDIVYAYASQIYMAAGINDTAYLFAEKLIRSKNNDHRRVGYGMLLSPELRKYSSPDSLFSYSSAYGVVLNEYLDRHDAEQATIQTSLYNYQTHERGRKKAEETKRTYMYVAGFFLISVLALCVGILYLRNKKMKIKLDYHKSLEDIGKLETLLSSAEGELVKYRKTIEEMKAKKNAKRSELNVEAVSSTHEDSQETEEDPVRKELKERLLRLQKAGEAKKNDPEKILGTSVFDRLQDNIVNKLGLKEDDEVWSEIESSVLKLSPEFKTNLTLLVGGKTKVDVYHMALLVRCGFGPTDTGALLGRTKGAVSARRGYICEKIFGKKYGGKVMDDIINLL